jgi:hypothetical protein
LWVIDYIVCFECAVEVEVFSTIIMCHVHAMLLSGCIAPTTCCLVCIMVP